MSVKERIALLLSIKEKGKLVEFDHIYEKVSRDVKFLEKRDVSKDEIISNLKTLEEEGLIKNVNGKYAPDDKIHDYISNLISQKEKVLNRSYILVWKAKHYYPIVSNLILPYLKDRPTSVVKVFSGKNNPIEEIDPIFVRYAKYKPKPLHIVINSSDKLMEYVHDHCIDFIPYVHKLNANEPDLFVLDLDAGKKIFEKKSGFSFLKYITKELYDMLIEFEINPMIKFSGSRGFQIWAKFDNSKFKSKEDLFAQYRRLAVKIQNLLEKRLQEKRKIIEEEFPEFKELKQFTTSQVAHKEEREDKVLVDWSSMKPQGDVRAPFSMHYKTGLVSVPLFKEEIDEFSVLEAEPMNLIKKIKEGKRFPELALSDPTKILKILG
jgi:bifunctional non-homologous end joining protein LigD